MKALLIVDVQNDFLPGGALAVPKSAEIIPIINALIPKFPLVVATKDWHPPSHMSFAANHPGKKIGDIVMLNGLTQILWPIHCVEETRGAEFAPELLTTSIAKIFHKGVDPWIDSYSAFFDNARQNPTGLSDYFKSHHVKEISIVGLATDYCVLYSAIDAIDEGFKAVVILEGCRGINLKPGDIERSVKTMRDAGVRVIDS